MNKRDRQIKKWTKRFIEPVIETLPSTIYGTQLILDDTILPARNHSIINGEGCVPRFRQRSLLENMRKTGEKAREIVSSYKYPHYRMFTTYNNSVRLRIITEVPNVDGR